MFSKHRMDVDSQLFHTIPDELKEAGFLCHRYSDDAGQPRMWCKREGDLPIVIKRNNVLDREALPKPPLIPPPPTLEEKMLIKKDSLKRALQNYPGDQGVIDYVKEEINKYQGNDRILFVNAVYGDKDMRRMLRG